jgi:hypothetical protein
VHILCRPSELNRMLSIRDFHWETGGDESVRLKIAKVEEFWTEIRGTSFGLKSLRKAGKAIRSGARRMKIKKYFTTSPLGLQLLDTSTRD